MGGDEGGKNLSSGIWQTRDLLEFLCYYLPVKPSPSLKIFSSVNWEESGHLEKL